MTDQTADPQKRKGRTLQEAICLAAGWRYCEEHDSALYEGGFPCSYLHKDDTPKHHHWCCFPEDECICGGINQ